VGGNNIGEDAKKEMQEGREGERGYQVVNVTCADYTNHGRRNSGMGMK
jgi:hypothetical protein